MTEKLYTLTEIAKETGYSTSTLRREAEKGYLKATKYGTVWLVAETDYEAWKNDTRRTPNKMGK